MMDRRTATMRRVSGPLMIAHKQRHCPMVLVPVCLVPLLSQTVCAATFGTPCTSSDMLLNHHRLTLTWQIRASGGANIGGKWPADVAENEHIPNTKCLFSTPSRFRIVCLVFGTEMDMRLSFESQAANCMEHARTQGQNWEDMHTPCLNAVSRAGDFLTRERPSHNQTFVQARKLLCVPKGTNL